MTDLRAENELLICIARRSLNDASKDKLRALTKRQIEWDNLLREAFDHGLLPLLYYHLNAFCRDLVPEPILTILREELLSNTRSNLYLLRELVDILKLLSANGIQALAFKGPILAAMVYGDLALRQAGDLDVLIQKKDFPRAKELLQSADYLMEPQLTPAQQSAHLRFHAEIQFVHPNQFSVIDLHWAVAPSTFPFVADPKSLLSRSTDVSVAGLTFRTLGPEDLLLYLCMHGAKHYWPRLEGVATIAELIRSSEAIDWDVLVNRAADSKGKRMLALGLLLAMDLFGSEVPTGILDSLPERKSLGQIALRIEQRLLRQAGEPRNQMERFRLHFAFMDRKRDAIMSYARVILVPTISDWQVVSLPGPTYPLYYLLRPARLIGKYGMRLVKRL